MHVCNRIDKKTGANTSWANVTMSTKTEVQAALAARIPVQFEAPESLKHHQDQGYGGILKIAVHNDIHPLASSGSILKTRAGVWTHKLVFRPAIQIVNLSPLDLDVCFEHDGVKSPCQLKSNGGRGELRLPGFGSVDFDTFDFDNFDIGITARCEMHGVPYTTCGAPFTVHGPTQDEDATLELLTDGQLPIRFHCVHDVGPSGSRIIQLYAPFLLVNTSGCPVQVCPNGEHSKTHAVTTTRGKLLSPLPAEEVKTWIHKVHMDAGTILPDSKLLRLACHHGIGHWCAHLTQFSFCYGLILCAFMVGAGLASLLLIVSELVASLRSKVAKGAKVGSLGSQSLTTFSALLKLLNGVAAKGVISTRHASRLCECFPALSSKITSPKTLNSVSRWATPKLGEKMRMAVQLLSPAARWELFAQVMSLLSTFPMPTNRSCSRSDTKVGTGAEHSIWVWSNSQSGCEVG